MLLVEEWNNDTEIRSLHRSQIINDLRAMQAVAADLFGYVGKPYRFFWRKEFESSLSEFTHLSVERRSISKNSFPSLSTTSAKG